MIEFVVEIVPCNVEGTSILRPVGSIDATAAPILESHFKNLWEKEFRNIIVDFSKSDFISSAGIGIFLGTVSRLRKTGGNIYFMNVPSHIDEIFGIINLKPFFRTIKTPEEIESVPRI